MSLLIKKKNLLARISVISNYKEGYSPELRSLLLLTATGGLSSTSPYLITFTRTVGIHCPIKMDLATNFLLAGIPQNI